MRPVMTITIHIGYTEGSLNRELPLPGGPGVGTSTSLPMVVAWLAHAMLGHRGWLYNAVLCLPVGSRPYWSYPNGQDGV
jgi:hypothetical protein